MEEEAEADDDEVRIGYFDARSGNSGAGMNVAIAILKNVELLRGKASVEDYRVLVTGAEAEQNPQACLELCSRLHKLAKLGVDR